MSELEIRWSAKRDLIETVDVFIKASIREKNIDFNKMYALIEQRNRAAKLFGIQQQGLKYFQ